LTEKGVEFESVKYMEQPLSADELRDLLKRAGLKPVEALRTGEPAYKEFVGGKDLTDDQLVQVMTEHPELIQRPIVVKGSKAVLARPAENLKKLGI